MALSPMMQQYMSIKEQNPDCLLFFRLGDFYEMFFEDAQLVSRELELVLTGRECGLSERAPMCGVPFHSADTYVSRLVEKGYKVAICEQMSDPALSKGLVDREVIRIVTPGTIMEGSTVNDREANYILSLYLAGDQAGIAFCDVGTGEFKVYPLKGVRQRLGDELARIAPKELLVNDLEQLGATACRVEVMTTLGRAAWYGYREALEAIKGHFGAKDAGALGLKNQRLCVQAAGALLSYLQETQKNALSHIMHLERFEPRRYMAIDRTAAYNLELTAAGRSRSRKGSLLGILDKTMTAMGSRMLRSWIEQPLQDPAEIEQRLDGVEQLCAKPMEADALREKLREVYDVERLLSRIAYETVHARDCLSLKRSLEAVPHIKAALREMSAGALVGADALLDPIGELVDLLERAISPDAPLSVREGAIIREGYNDELDTLRLAARDGKNWIAELEQREREKTGIKNLKVGFNRVFGYYIEVTKSYYDLVPEDYTRKQTLSNCEHFITEELKKIERIVLGSDEQAIRLEYELFVDVRRVLKEMLPRLQGTAQGLKTLDALLSLALAAQENQYVRPALNQEGAIDIREGRHPVVEQAMGRDKFVPNDTHISSDSRLMIITGPNMAGKSTYMRQVALIVLMAHIGSFVPAQSANIPVTDRIFTRIGASDDLYGGQSTFMVEMSEVATILKYATPRSLVVLDEVGRGTSTFDGLSIAWAVVEHLADKTRARTLFATHYHELSELEGQLEGVKNYRITAKEQGEDVIFLRRIVPGGADRSYGVAVAKLAGLPAGVLSRARQIMARLEVTGELHGSIGQNILDTSKNAGNKQVGMLDYRPMELVEEIREVDVMALTPIEALNLLYNLCEKARRI